MNRADITRLAESLAELAQQTRDARSDEELHEVADEAERVASEIREKVRSPLYT